MTIADIVIPRSGAGIKFSYLVPEYLESLAETGKAALVPLKNRTVCGFIYDVKKDAGNPEASFSSKNIKLKSIKGISRARFFDEKHKDIYNFLSRYYHENISGVLDTVLPSIDAKRFGLLDKYYEEAAAAFTASDAGSAAAPENDKASKYGFLSEAPYELTEDQSAAAGIISNAVRSGNYGTFLLHGVTASGKTEIYFNILDLALTLNKQAVILVPEIFITNQFIHLIKKRFKGIVESGGFAVFHSKVSIKEKLVNWMKIMDGNIRLAIGARSAIFAPFKNPGIIIVDEEHDGSYKQQSGLLYNARDFAVMLAKKNSAACVLGSATPSLESYYNATVLKKYEYIHIKNRVKGKTLPEIKIMDLKKEFGSRNVPIKKEFQERLMPDETYQMIKKTVDEKRQVLLFLNRRGFSTFIICSSCGRPFICKNCSISLVYHKTGAGRGKDGGREESGASGYLECHYCGYKEDVPKLCPECGNDSIEPFGAGIQKLEDAVRGLFYPAAGNSGSGGVNIARIDSDIARSKKRGAEIFKKMRKKEIDVLIGTQIAAKGHDFPDIGLVVVVSADGMLNLPDFRSAERAFQSLTQVSGRAGRGETPGVIAIQTFMEGNYLIRYAANHDTLGFYARELEIRDEYGYPPYSRIIALKLTDKDAERLKKTASDIGRAAGMFIESAGFNNINVLGPAPCPIEKIKNDYRYQIIFKARPPYSSLHKLINMLKTDADVSKYFTSQKITVDVDPDVLI